ncbi:hypothetical protein GE061_011725 [Apolygus lucorum]|uniref:Uncharacterized protein n=1 Tax=Apolygus lucorum TaxID=248454 RepID=A0A6A4K8N4_APOLU|nr:hypothetical protein GE061_011725 [Apolygus lucorum]
MMKLSLLVGIAACVGFAPTGSEAGKYIDKNPLKITPELMKELKRFLAMSGHKDVIPVKILSATKQEYSSPFSTASYDFQFVNSINEPCDYEWELMRGGNVRTISGSCYEG